MLTTDFNKIQQRVHKTEKMTNKLKKNRKLLSKSMVAPGSSSLSVPGVYDEENVMRVMSPLLPDIPYIQKGNSNRSLLQQSSAHQLVRNQVNKENEDG